MAAYATLLSLTNLIERIQLYHAHHPNFLDGHQKQLQSLQKKVTNLQDFLEWCSEKGCSEARGLESQMVDAANGAEDLIENHIVHDIHGQAYKQQMVIAPSSFLGLYDVSPEFFSQDLQKVIECMDLLEKKVMEIKEESMYIENKSPADMFVTGSMESSPGQNNDMVVFEDEFRKIMSKLIMGHKSNLKVISLTGMGGIGKSTLARNVLDNKSTVNYFDVRGWIIVSQVFNAKRRIFEMLKDISVLGGDYEEERYDYHQLGGILYQHLFGRRFLIIVDDIWDVKDWEKIKRFLPDNSNGSRIILTTRLSNVAVEVGSYDIHGMKFLDENTSWSLLCKNVFRNEACPPELQEIGKKIAKNCKGLPLSLSVIGGLLAKLKKTPDCWLNIVGDINRIVCSEDDERYLKILALSYTHLPIHLKPLFLYMGIFPEDHIGLEVESLIELWILEGFLKPCGATENLEEVAQEYLEDLIERNLLYLSMRGYTGKMRQVRIHDLLRDLALREAQKEKFIHITTLHDPNFSFSINSERRVGLHDPASYEKHKSECENALSTATFLRSLICDAIVMLPLQPPVKLLRISYLGIIEYSPEAIFHLINSRNLLVLGRGGLNFSVVQFLWNLQIITIKRREADQGAPFYDTSTTFPLWEMPLLRKLSIDGVTLPDLPHCQADGKGELVLANLQLISGARDIRFTDAVVMKIFHVKKLLLFYNDANGKGVSHYHLSNLGHFDQLQSLNIIFVQNMDWPTRTDMLHNIGLSKSLKVLLLGQCSFEWEYFTTTVGSLPHLEDLALYDCYTEEEWNSDEGFFLCLQTLRLRTCRNLVRWSIEYNPFPCLEHLFLWKLERLEEIPPEIGDIPSLQSIRLTDCSNLIVASAKTMLKEQRSIGNDGFAIFLNDKHLQEEEEEEEEEEERERGGDEEGEGRDLQEDQEEEREVQEQKQEKKKKKHTGFLKFIVPFLAILGFSYVLHHAKFGGRGRGGGGGGKSENRPKENDERRKEVDDSWWQFYDYP